MVRYYLLTGREREILMAFLDRGLRLEGYRELKHLLNKMDIIHIDEDRELVKRFLDKEAKG